MKQVQQSYTADSTVYEGEIDFCTIANGPRWVPSLQALLQYLRSEDITPDDAYDPKHTRFLAWIRTMGTRSARYLQLEWMATLGQPNYPWDGTNEYVCAANLHWYLENAYSWADGIEQCNEPTNPEKWDQWYDQWHKYDRALWARTYRCMMPTPFQYAWLRAERLSGS